MKFLVIFEPTETGYGAYSPDVPGCVAVGETLEETEALIKEAIAFHLDGLQAEGLPSPMPKCLSTFVDVASEAMIN